MLCRSSLRRSAGLGDRVAPPAFTLIEMIVVIAVLSIVAVVSFHFVVTVAQWYDQTARQSRTDEKALAAVSRLEREIRTLSSTQVASNTLFRFVNQDSQVNAIEYSTGVLNWNGYTLADGVNSFSMIYYDSTNGITADTNLVRRIGMDFRITDGNAISDVNVNFFYPKVGTMK
jgi:prepilin-type N-terminal cleavage/methylation domain-containing protein